jgi:plastocyanin
MKTKLFFIIAVLFAISLTANATKVNVAVTNTQFTPSTVTAHPGDSVVWNNTQGFHNVHHTGQPTLFGNSPAGAPWTYTWVVPQEIQPGNYPYMCEIHGSGMSGTVIVQAASAVEENPAISAGYKLEQNYPNPFNSQTEINFEVPYASKVKLTLYNVLGNEVKELASGLYSTGSHKISFDASNYSTGLYYYQLETPAGILTRSMMYVK